MKPRQDLWGREKASKQRQPDFQGAGEQAGRGPPRQWGPREAADGLGVGRRGRALMAQKKGAYAGPPALPQVWGSSLVSQDGGLHGGGVVKGRRKRCPAKQNCSVVLRASVSTGLGKLSPAPASNGKVHGDGWKMAPLRAGPSAARVEDGVTAGLCRTPAGAGELAGERQETGQGPGAEARSWMQVCPIASCQRGLPSPKRNGNPPSIPDPCVRKTEFEGECVHHGG